MKLFLQGLVALSAAATPQAQTVTETSSAIVRAQAPAFQRQMALWEEKQERLQLVNEELDSIVEDVIQMAPEEGEMLDPVLMEMFVRKAELDEIILAAQENFKTGVIRSQTDVDSLNEILEVEIAALEEAVGYLRVALDEHLNAVIEI